MNKYQFLIVMKLIALLHITAFLQISLAGHAQRITYQARNQPIAEILKAIPKQTDFEVVGNRTMFSPTHAITVNVTDMEVVDFLELVLKDQPLGYRLVDKTIMLEPASAKKQAEGGTSVAQLPIRGTVTAMAGDKQVPLPGATIALKGLPSVIAGEDGRFTLTRLPADNRIVVSYMGYQAQTIALVAGKTDYAILLEEEASQMDEVVITGYQIINRDTYTGTAITKSGEELQQVAPQNVLQAMQVFDPSFRLMENNLAGGNPNALPNITVRGSSALPAGTESGVLRRDNITATTNMPAFILDGYEVDVQKVMDLDMTRIASVTLLKDAAATAVYGSRAANGVMVIVTKAPKDGTLRLSYSHETNVNGPDLSGYQILNAAEKLEYERLTGRYDASHPSSRNIPQEQLDVDYYGRLAAVVGGVDTYWLSQPVRTAVGQRHGLFVEGGSQAFRYGVDLRYQTRPGVMKGSHRNQYSGGMNFAYNPNPKIRFQNELSITVVDGQESPYGNFEDYVRMNPYFRLADDNGNILQAPDRWMEYSDASGFSPHSVLNPMYNSTLNNFDRARYNEIVDNLSAEFELAPNLRLRGQVSLIKRMHREDSYLSPMSNEFFHYTTDEADERGSYTNGINDELFWDGNIRLNYIKQVGDHNINFVAGTNIRTERADWRSYTAIGFPNDRFTSIGFAKGYAEDGKPRSQLDASRLFGALGSVNYAYRNRYLMDASFRMDGSSKFGSDNRTAPFWSAGLGWNVHEESWFNSNAINMLRLRFTTGLTGSVQFSPFMARSTYHYQPDNRYSSGIGAIIATYGNRNLSWQKTLNTDIGFDLGMFDGKLLLTPRVYRRLTRDILADISIAPSTGFSSYKENLGDMENRGAEVNVSWTAVRSADWTVTLSGNFAHNSNKIVRISNALKAYNDRVNDAQQDEGLRGVPLLRYNEGQSVDAIYAVPSLGIDPENGREVFVKRDGSLSYDWDARDITVVGNATPKAEGSFGTTTRYKQFMLVAYFRTHFGGERYNQTLVDRVENADPRYNVDRRVLDDKWRQPGDLSFYKNIADIGQTQVSSRFVMPDNMLLLQSVFLSYDVDQRLASRLSMSRLRIGLTANDLFRWSSVVEERGINYPFARSVTFSLQASF